VTEVDAFVPPVRGLRASLASAPSIAIWSWLAIFLTVLGFNLLGDGLQDALEVKG
jgi:peptide/nickel transport system permease protein